MKLQTKVPIAILEPPITYESRLVLLGSCFSEHIGTKLGYYQFRSYQNPLGILFHSSAIAKLIHRAIKREMFTVNDMVEQNGRWYCFEAHSGKSAATSQQLADLLNTILVDTLERLLTATHVMITLGTAWGYRYTHTDQLVANCHKVPQGQFTKELLSVERVTHDLQEIIRSVQSINPKATYVFTVSPVRHLKDGFIANQRSKAHLIAAIQDVLELPALDAIVHYFPAYEILMDELRDYRFYTADMVHPSPLAIDYIWERFTTAFIGPNCKIPMEKVADVQKGLAHRPFHPGSDAHAAFLKKLTTKIAYLEKKYGWMKFSSQTAAD